MMRSVAAAAGGEARFIFSSQRGRERPEAEEENEEDGESTPHLGIIVHDDCVSGIDRILALIFRAKTKACATQIDSV